MATVRKRETVKELNQLFTKSEVMIFTDYRGLTVADLKNLRRQLREKNVEYHIAKNSLTTIAARRAGQEGLADMLDGPTAIAFVGQDIPGAAKVLQDFARTSRIMTIRGGLAGKQLLSANQVSDLTKILTREQYIAKMMGSLNSPAQNIVGVLSNTLRGLMNVFQARIDQMNEGGEAAPVEASASIADDAVEATAPIADGASEEAAPAEASASIADGEATDPVTASASIAGETAASTSDAPISAATASGDAAPIQGTITDVATDVAPE